MDSALAQLHRAEWGRLLSALIRALGDFQLAEDALQDSFADALAHWASAPPREPAAWLYAAARNKAIDRLRRQGRLEQRLAMLGQSLELQASPQRDSEGVDDERLRLVLTCCHPALAPEAQVALTLRCVCGLTTEEIARAFLLPAATLAQRLVRAKAKIRDAGIPYAIPPEEELPERLESAMAVIYLVFNEGYSAARGEALVRRELCADALALARLLCERLHALGGARSSELESLLALMLFQDSRRDARVDAEGGLVLLAEQDRARWDRRQIEEGVRVLEAALTAGPPGSYALQASIAAVHASSESAAATDWRQIAALYDRLLRLHASPVVALNRAVAVSMAEGPAAALPLVDALAGALAGYHLWHATRADLLRRLDRAGEARESYQRARELSQNEAERHFLARRIAAL